MVFCVSLGMWLVYKLKWFTYLSPSTEPYTPFPGNAEITGVTGSALPNGVLTDRVENPIKKANVTSGLVDRVSTACINKVKIKVMSVQTPTTWLKTWTPHSVTCSISSASQVSQASDAGKQRLTNSTVLEWGTVPRLKKCNRRQASCGLCKPAD